MFLEMIVAGLSCLSATFKLKIWISLSIIFAIVVFIIFTYRWMTKKCFSSLIKHTIRIFENQRLQRYEFAVLFLAPCKNFMAMRICINFQTKRESVHNDPDLATNCQLPTFPQDDNLCNYVTARPEQRRHAEELLLDELSTLISNYSLPCKSIVLYTWFLPCINCKDKIINTLSPYIRSEHQVILAYTIKMKDITDEESTLIVKDLEKAGITVKKVEYPQRLQSRM